jgi:hypothetical protein
MRYPYKEIISVRCHGVGHPGCLCTTPQHLSTEGKEHVRIPT